MERNLFKLQHHLRQSIQSSSFTRPLHTAQNPLLAGHSKWANIRHIKAEKDGQKSTIFTRISRQIRLAIQEGGSADPAMNSQLRSIIDEGLRKNMPMATIQNSIKKSQQSKSELKKYRLEMRYKQKVFAICVLYTDNFQQVKMDMAPIVKKSGASFIDAAHMFDNFGLIETTLDKSVLSSDFQLEERATEDAIECGAEDIELISSESGAVNFICSPIQINGVRKAIEAKGYIVENAEHVYTAKNLIQLSEEELKAYEIFVKKLCDLQGVEDIYDNVQLESTE